MEDEVVLAVEDEVVLVTAVAEITNSSYYRRKHSGEAAQSDFGAGYWGENIKDNPASIVSGQVRRKAPSFVRGYGGQVGWLSWLFYSQASL